MTRMLRTRFAVAALAWGLAGLAPVRAQVAPTLSIQQVIAKAQQLVSSGHYAEATPYLNEMVKALRPSMSKNSSYRTLVEFASFQLAVAALEGGKPDEALAQAAQYRTEFPAGQYVLPSRLLELDVHAAKKAWEQVISTGEQLARERLDGRQLLMLQQLMGEAYFNLRQWKKAIAPLIFSFQNAPRVDARGDAAAMLATCLMRLEDLPQLFKFMPIVYRTQARYDAGLNLSLLEGGDDFASKSDNESALLVYRLVAPKQELVDGIEGRLRQAKTRREELRSDPASGEASRRLDRQIGTLEAQLKEIRAYPDYDRQLTLRIAAVYYELHRYLEALLMYRNLYEEDPRSEFGDQALYSAFSTAVAMGDFPRAYKEGYEYLKVLPQGLFFDPLSAQLVQVHMERQEYDKALALGEKLLAERKDHKLRDQLLYMVGYSYIQTEQFEKALVPLADVKEHYADGRFAEAGWYWRGMAYMFMSKYAEGQQEFETFLQRYDTGLFSEDALYRVATCQFGRNLFADAEKTFGAFVERYPGSHLKSEAISMIGDVQASRGELDQAIASYQRGIASAENQVQINYATFQIARTLELEAKWDDIVRLFENYNQRYGVKGNFTEGAYWIGTAKMRKNDSQGALDTFFNTLLEYGNDLPNAGVDMIIRDLTSEKTERLNVDARRAFMDRLYQKLDDVRRERKRTLELRLMALFALTSTSEENRHALAAAMVREANIPIASPLCLSLMGAEATRMNQPEMARRIYEHFLNTYRDSDFAFDALNAMADAAQKRGDVPGATALYREIIERFAGTPGAGEAQKRLGDMSRDRGDYAAAIEAYNTVLQVKEWRGPLWPECLYNIGACHLAQKKPQEAFAFFQRVYVLYQAYDVWTARAYLRSGECLEQLGKRDEAVRTYREMLDKPARAQRPEAETARQNLKRLGASS